MVLVLPDTSGIGEGIQQAGGALGGALQQALKARQETQFYNQIFGGGKGTSQATPQAGPQKATPEMDQKFIDTAQEYENTTGEPLDASQLDFMWKAMTQNQQAQQAKAGGQRYNAEQLAAIARKNPQLAALLQNRELAEQKIEQRETLAKQARAAKENEPYIEQVNKLRDTVPNKEVALMRIRDAMASGNIKGLRNWLAEQTGQPNLRNASANDLRSAVKEFFLADMQSMPAGTRLNQFIEKNLMQALEGEVLSPASNQKIAEYQQFTIDVGNKEIELADNIAEKYEAMGLEPPPGVKRQVHKQLKEYTMERQKELSQTYKDINEGKVVSKGALRARDAKTKTKNLPAGEGKVWMVAPDGIIKSVPKGLVKQAQEKGAQVVQ